MPELPKGITHRKDGLYMWRFQYEGQSYAGYAKTAKKAEKELQEKRYEVEHGLYCKEKNITVDDWFKTWLETYKTGCKASTVYCYEKDYKTHIQPEFGTKKLKAIRPEQLQKFLNECSQKYAGSTVGNINIILYGMFNRAYKNGIIAKNVADKMEPPKKAAATKKGAASKEMEDIFFGYAANSPYYRLYKLASLTGMRVGEVCGLRWGDVDFNKAIIHVRHSLNYIPKSGFILDTPKTKSSIRDIPMIEEAKNVLFKERLEQNKKHMKNGMYWKPLEGLNGLVFTTKFGTPLYEVNINKDMREIKKKMNADGVKLPEKFTFHSLRHCFATRCIENGMNMKTLQAILGHSSITMTMDTYADCLPDTKEQEMKKVAVGL